MPPYLRRVGLAMIGFWVLMPPVYFWTEWVFFTDGKNDERLKHTHDLARNIWLSLVLVLVALLGVKWPGS